MTEKNLLIGGKYYLKKWNCRILKLLYAHQRPLRMYLSILVWATLALTSRFIDLLVSHPRWCLNVYCTFCQKEPCLLWWLCPYLLHFALTFPQIESDRLSFKFPYFPLYTSVMAFTTLLMTVCLLSLIPTPKSKLFDDKGMSWLISVLPVPRTSWELNKCWGEIF